MNPLWQNDTIAIWQSQQDSFCDTGVYGFNVGMHVGDNPNQVLARRALLLQHLAPFGVNELVWVNQIHGSDVYHHKGYQHIADADAIISKQHGVGLCIMTADCVPIALFDAPTEAKLTTIGCIHAGHQGLVKGVIGNTVRRLGGGICAYVGACIGGCYELPSSLATEIITRCITNGHNGDEAWTALTMTGADKALIDVGLLARAQLTRLGVTILNATQPCSYHQNYHSHRRASHLGQPSGRMAMVIAKIRSL